ncbi:MAG: 16S rRNA (cytosine(967)-C(5))-methyltransferase RsmB, partial [Actinobacteria bacterium]|nr:16S rRNA (cytosine(967)-C(5))-methyltransferase RsmB [Actinomycetota bacterium]
MATGPNRGRRSSSAARELALRVLRRVLEQGAYSNLALSGELTRSKLPRADRELASELVRGTLRRKVTLDWYLSQVLDRPIGRVETSALAVLELGAYQLLFMRIPPHAAVGETVSLAPERARGFVNAVLRRLSRRTPELPDGRGEEDVAVRTGLAPWAVGELRRLVPAGELEPAAAGLASRAPLSLRANRCRTTADELEATLGESGAEVRRSDLHPDVLLLEGGGDPARLPGFTEGGFAIQDQASALVVAALDPQPGERILDACAGPGGKAADIACRAQGGRTVAADLTERRAKLIAETSARLGAPLRVLVQDARHPALREGFDRVLVDAPCSGLGSARRRPELLWRQERSDLSVMARLQVSILGGAAALVRPGGVVVYS